MKNCEEWSLEFDRLYDNITSSQAPGLTEYEKSAFLTRAQETIVLGLYNRTLGRAFEETEEVTEYLASLVTQKTISQDASDLPHVVVGSRLFKLPDDLLFRTLELCTISDQKCGDLEVVVVPVTQDEYWRTSRNPFKGPNKRRVLRLTQGNLDGIYSEIVSGSPVKDYTVRYIRKPEPIILVDLEDGLSINGQTEARTCELHESLHQLILTEAVRMAKAVWQS